jgi:hypothetical protein
MTAREQHLSDMLDRALELVDHERSRARQSSVSAAALVSIEARLQRIEHALSLQPPSDVPPRPRRPPDPRRYPDIRLALARGPLDASEVAKAVYRTDHVSASQRARIWAALKRLARDGVVTFDVVNKRYALAPVLVVAEAS